MIWSALEHLRKTCELSVVLLTGIVYEILGLPAIANLNLYRRVCLCVTLLRSHFGASNLPFP